MPAVHLTADDVLVFNPQLDHSQAEILVKDGLALAARIAPCITQDDFQFPEAAVAIIRGAVLRWAESGPGAVSSTQRTAGPYSEQTTYDTSSTRRSLFFPSEIKELQALCQTNSRAAFGVDTASLGPRSRCLDGGQPGCRYLFGSTNSPCETCGEVLRPGWWEKGLE